MSALFVSEFLVNVTTSAGEDLPSVAALANGNFVVAWEDNAAGTNDGKFRVYHADGTSLTGELPLNTSLAGNQGRPVVAALANGDFAVAWRDDAGGDFDVKGRIYHADGASADGRVFPCATFLAKSSAFRSWSRMTASQRPMASGSSARGVTCATSSS